MLDKKTEEEKSQAQKQLDEFRKTGIAYYNPEDEEFMDFSKVDKDHSTVNEDKDDAD